MRTSVRIKVDECVMGGRALCAELLLSSRAESKKDWIATGSIPMYTPWLGPSAQSGVLPSGHPIVEERREEREEE